MFIGIEIRNGAIEVMDRLILLLWGTLAYLLFSLFVGWPIILLAVVMHFIMKRW